MPEKPITSLPVDRELHACPACSYALGFHTSFVSANTAGRDTPVRSTREVFRVILVCPECGARYDVGWRVPLEPRGTVTCMPHASPADCLPASRRPEPDSPG